MNYVVVDLEWNQAMSSKSSVFNKLPIHLGGEIIEIGAVKLKEDMTPGEEFTIDVKPVYFRRMHYKVKKITGFDKERLAHGIAFADALEQFRAWCGDGVTFITWGNDDPRIMEQTRVAHDALGDAYNTALVASRLDMLEGLRLYPDAARILASRMPNFKPPVENEGPDTLCHESFEGFESKAVAFADERVTKLACPHCGGETACLKWVNQGDQRYMNIYTCPEHGAFLVRAKFRKNTEDNTWSANKLVYEADEDMQGFYKTKAAQARRRSRGHSHRKNRPASKQ